MDAAGISCRHCTCLRALQQSARGTVLRSLSAPNPEVAFAVPLFVFKKLIQAVRMRWDSGILVPRSNERHGTHCRPGGGGGWLATDFGP